MVPPGSFSSFLFYYPLADFPESTGFTGSLQSRYLLALLCLPTYPRDGNKKDTYR